MGGLQPTYIIVSVRPTTRESSSPRAYVQVRRVRHQVRLPTAPELSQGPDGPTWVSSYPCLDLVNQEVVRYAFTVVNTFSTLVPE